MSSLQPLYDVKDRLEAAAIAGTGLLDEDFRLRRAAENMKPLAAASPVFGKISAGLDRLLAAPAEDRPGLLLDVLSLVDAVAYTQGKSGMDGEIEPLPVAGGTYIPISYNQMQPILTALTSSGSGRVEAVRSAWENHPEFFLDYRVLPALVAGLGDSYGEMAELNMKILKQAGPAALPLLKQGFDPAGNRAMVRRVEVIAALQGAESTPWLREILPDAKKDVRAAVITALGGDGDNTALLLDLTRSERGGNRDAALQALALQDGAEVRAFWEKELAEHSQSVKFLEPSNADWAIDLVTTGLRQRLEELLAGETPPAKEKCDDAAHWCDALGRKDSPVMMDFWKWADEHMEAIDRIETNQGKPVFLGVRLTDHRQSILCATGPGPLRDYCLTLWDRYPSMTRYLSTSFLAAALSRPAEEDDEKYSPYILTSRPLLNAERKKTAHAVLLRALNNLYWDQKRGCHALVSGQYTAEPLDIRWIERLTHAIQKGDGRKPSGTAYWERVPEFDVSLMRLINAEDEATRKLMIPYLRKQLEEAGQPYIYSQYLFRLGASPKGILGKAMARDNKSNRLGVLWQLMNEAAKALPAGEVADLLDEILASDGLTRNVRPSAEKIFPWAAEQLRAGKPFPDWSEWMNAGK